MLKGSALLYTLTISLIVASLSGALIWLSFFNNKQFDLIKIESKLYSNARSGIELILNNQIVIIPGKELPIDLFDDGNDSVSVSTAEWGLYKIAISKAKHNHIQAVKVAMIGNRPIPSELVAIYLANHNEPIHVSGKTFIKGMCFLPRGALTKTNIQGKSFEGIVPEKEFLKKSQKHIPEISESVIDENLKWFIPSNQMLTNYNEIKISNNDSIFVPFLSSTMVYISSEAIILEEVNLKGNIRIISSNSITIDSSCKLEDIILYAPSITVKDGFNGILQLFATSRIIIGKSSKFNYPSTLCLIRDKSSPVQPKIELEKDIYLNGTICIFQKTGGQKSPKLVMGPSAMIEGIIHVEGNVELKGKIYGTLYCDKIIYRTAGGIYDNHLVDVTIDAEQLSKHFVSGMINQQSDDLTIIKWLN